jgi:hypothetical protein
MEATITNTEYVARVIRYYSKNKPKLGTLEFDLMQGRFIIKDQKGNPVSSYPGTGLHCGDVYIVQNTDKSWHIAQCELVEDMWKMVGSDITDESEPTGVIYVPHDRLMRFADFWVDDTWKLGALSNEFINMLL